MAYVYAEAEDLVDLPSVGTRQCVALIKEFAGAPPSSLWKEGASVRGNMTLKKGTAIATFVDGRYQNHVSGNHAAFYISQDSTGILVVDQWSTSGTIRERRLLFLGKGKDGRFVRPSNNGDAFSVVE